MTSSEFSRFPVSGPLAKSLVKDHAESIAFRAFRDVAVRMILVKLEAEPLTALHLCIKPRVTFSSLGLAKLTRG